jgi:Ca2+/Na+ antiporter
MGRKLDNWSFGLSLTSVLGSLIISITFPLLFSSIVGYALSLLQVLSLPAWLIFIVSIFFTLGMLAGFIVGIIALTKKPQKKWKPILAITLPIIYYILSLFVIGKALSGVFLFS